MVLQTIGAIYTRARATVPEPLLTRLASIAAKSLIWEPEPAMLCAWSMERGDRIEPLVQWLASDDDLAAFATWIASKITKRTAELRHALETFASRGGGQANPRVAHAIERAKALLAT